VAEVWYTSSRATGLDDEACRPSGEAAARSGRKAWERAGDSRPVPHAWQRAGMGNLSSVVEQLLRGEAEYCRPSSARKAIPLGSVEARKPAGDGRGGEHPEQAGGPPGLKTSALSRERERAFRQPVRRGKRAGMAGSKRSRKTSEYARSRVARLSSSAGLSASRASPAEGAGRPGRSCRPRWRRPPGFVDPDPHVMVVRLLPDRCPFEERR